MKKSQKIAIVGIGCRFPGGADTPEKFWKLLSEGRDAIVEVPSDRWNVDSYFDSNPESPGKMYTRWGGFLQSDVSQFDSGLFQISPLEATEMDPQQRISLEVVWETLENAQMTFRSPHFQDSGVFMGVFSHDYADISQSKNDKFNPFTNLGSSLSAIAGRISHHFGFQGPSLSVDTASSSSLVAIHLACESLRLGNCRMAVAGGVNLILKPELTIGFCKAGAMSKDGKCKVFSDDADGYVRAEGCGIVLLKTLEDAEADGDLILGVIRGSAVNQGGRTEHLMSPSAEAQRRLYLKALADAELFPSDIDYIEAHGTGTVAGDFSEMQALKSVYGRDPSEHALWVGSVKTNIGHSESVAGVAGLIKCLLALKNQEIPKNLHFQKPHPNLNMDSAKIIVPTQNTNWNVAPGKLRRAAVSSFGFTGTNAHLIVEEYLADSAKENVESGLPSVLCLSANDQNALSELKKSYLRFIQENPKVNVRDLCSVAAEGRNSLPVRWAAPAFSVSELIASLSSLDKNLEEGAEVPGRFDLKKVSFSFGNAFDFHLCSATNLIRQSPHFLRALHHCSRILNSQLGIEINLEEFVGKGLDGNTVSSRLSIPASFSFQFASAMFWQNLGLNPGILFAGRGVGELIAACVSGLISLEDALWISSQLGMAMDSNEFRMSETFFKKFNERLGNSAQRKCSIPVFSLQLGRILEKKDFLTSDWCDRLMSEETKNQTWNHPDQSSINFNFTSELNSMESATFINWLKIANSQIAFSDLICKAYRSGFDLLWEKYFWNQFYRKPEVMLPNYTFQRQRFWIESIISNQSLRTKNDFSNFADEIDRMLDEDREPFVRKLITMEVGKILGRPDVHPERPMKDQGLDSLMSVELRNRLQAILGKKIKLHATLVLDCPSVNSLSRFISQALINSGISDKKITQSSCENQDDELLDKLSKLFENDKDIEREIEEAISFIKKSAS